MNRTWEDQPEELERTITLACFYLKVRSVEVRKDLAQNVYYVSAGNIFGSETLRCSDADAVFRVIHVLGGIPERRRSLTERQRL